MKIAFVYDTVYPWVTGGAEKRIFELGKRLVNRGNEVHIFSLGYWMEKEEYKSNETLIYEGMTLHSVGKPSDLYTDDGKRSIKEALYFARCISKVDFDGFDIVDCQGFPYFSCFSTKFKISKNTHLVITVHEVWNDYWYEYLGKKGFFGKIIENRMFHLTDNIICVSEMTRDNMLKIHKPKNSTIIPNGVNSKEIIYLDPQKDYCDVIFAGRLIPEKNVELLINSIKKVTLKHPYVKCYIVGNGSNEDKLKKLTKGLNLENNVFFKDFCKNQKELYSLIKSSSIFVLPSTREGFGIVVLEANACGIPVITIDSPMNAAKNLITSKNGFIIDNDSDQLAELISNCLTNGIELSLRDSCRQVAKKYDWEHITTTLEDYYFKIIHE